MLNKKCFDTIKYILLSNETSIKEISKEFNMSERAVYYNFNRINYFLEKNNLPTYKINKGTVFNTNNDDIKSFIVKYKESNIIDSDERLAVMRAEIAFNEKINLTHFCKKYKISRGTARNDFLIIKEELKNNFNLTITNQTKEGLLLKGEEHNIRNLQIKLINSLDKKFITKFTPQENTSALVEFIDSCQKKLNIIISDKTYSILLNYLKIIVTRLQLNKTILKVDGESFLKQTKEFLIIKETKPIIEKAFNIKLSLTEMLKLSDYVLGSHVYGNNKLYFENWLQIDLLVDKIIKKFISYYPCNIKNDRILFNGLVTHIKPMIHRAINNMEWKNDIQLELDADILNSTIKAITIVEEFVGLKLNEDEITLITAHFQSAVNRNKINNNPIKILIACSMGFGTSQLLAQQINDLFYVKIVDIIPIHTIKKYTNDDIEAIITTGDIDEDKIKYKIPILKINPILKHEDIQKLTKLGLKENNNYIDINKLIYIIEEHCIIKDRNSLEINLRNNFKISSNNNINNNFRVFIELEKNSKNWQEALLISSQPLIKNNIIEKEYISDMMNNITKYGSYMVITDFIALPHANNSSYVKSSGASIVTFNNPVMFPDNIPVDVIITFASIDNYSHMKFLDNLLLAITEKDFYNIIKYEKNVDIVHNLLGY